MDSNNLLRDAFRACEPDRPLRGDDPRWQDLSAARGDDATASLIRLFELSNPEDKQHIVFFSHRGAGKTTELNRLAWQLRDRFLTLPFEANTELDPMHLEAEDLLLAIAVAVERTLRERGTPLPEDVLAETQAWFKEQIVTTAWGKSFEASTKVDAKAGWTIPFLTSLLAEASALFKTQASEHTEVRDVLRQRPIALVAHVNRLLEAADRVLEPEGRRLLVVIDNLDRYKPEIADKLLNDRGGMLRDLNTRLILTPPIALLYRPVSESLCAAYHVEVMNTLRLRRPEQGYAEFDGVGRDLMVQALEKRFPVRGLFPRTEDLDRLVSASGGAMRELLHLIQRAILLTKADVLERPAIERAIANTRQQLRDMINLNGWMPTLRKIAAEKQPSSDVHCMDVLYHRLALKYNGEGWYDVHPLVAEIDGFAEPPEVA